MKYWVVPSNDHTFRIGDAIAAQDGLVDWRTDKFSEGDIVFIYKTKPAQCIRYKMEVVKTKMIFNEIFEQEAFWTDKDQYYSGIVTYYARFKLLEEYTDNILSLHARTWIPRRPKKRQGDKARRPFRFSFASTSIDKR